MYAMWIVQLSFGNFCLSIRRNPPVLNGEGRLRESTHSRHKGIVVMLSPAQWCSSVQLLPVCIYIALPQQLHDQLQFCALLVSYQRSDSVNRQWLYS